MAKKGKKSNQSSRSLRKRRIFSVAFKQARVKEIERGLLSVSQMSRLYKVSSQTIYNWLYKYSKTMVKGTVQVIQMESESQQKQELLTRVNELEAALGRKQLELDYLEKLVSLASEEYQVDLKKSYATKSSIFFTSTGTKEDTK